MALSNCVCLPLGLGGGNVYIMSCFVFIIINFACRRENTKQLCTIGRGGVDICGAHFELHLYCKFIIKINSTEASTKLHGCGGAYQEWKLCWASRRLIYC